MVNRKALLVVVVASSLLLWAAIVCASGGGHHASGTTPVPLPLDQYHDEDMSGILSILRYRIDVFPFNLIAALIFLCAIVHTFLTSKFTAIANRWHHHHEEKLRQGKATRGSAHMGAGLFHFLGEVEAVFGLWVVPLVLAVVVFYDWRTVVSYIGEKVNFTEPLFVVVIMTLAATRPILKLAEGVVSRIANFFGAGLVAWWLTVLTIGPLLGSFITEPAAMTICALLLAKNFYHLEPSEILKYATIGLLFVNISVGGTLTHFAAPPVLMVAAPWKWTTVHMLTHFGWKAITGIVLSNLMYFLAFRKELGHMQERYALQSMKSYVQKEFMKRRDLEDAFENIGPVVTAEIGFREAIELKTTEAIDKIKQRLAAEYLPRIMEKADDPALIQEAFDKRFEEIRISRMRRLFPGLLPEKERAPFYDPDWDDRDDPVPWWMVLVHVSFMVWTILNVHHPALFIPGLLFFLGFAEVTSEFQNRIDLRQPMMVGFFLGGLVIHGGMQGWWIDPILSSLSEVPLMLGATILTAFNDNAAITYLSTLVPGFTAELKYAVVAGAVAGGGLTVIANAPNPAGQSLLKQYFKNGISPVRLLGGALIPTIIMVGCFMVLR